MNYILALDQGTTSSRAILFDKAGTVVDVSQKEFEQIFPRPGWVEHNPSEIWETQLGVARDVLTSAGVAAQEVSAIGITNQRETTIVWDRKTGEPIYNAIVWQDRRTATLCDQLKSAGMEETVKSRSGLLLDPYFSGTKLKWILDTVDGARQAAEDGQLAFGTVDSWLVWNLTGGQKHVTDVSNASRTMLFNIHDVVWDDELLQMLDIPRSVLPEACASSGSVGETQSELFGTAIPIAGIAGDQQAALFGQLCTEPGMTKSTYGTGCFILMNTGTKVVRSEHNLLSTIAWQIDGKVEYALEGSVFIGGAVVQWLRDGLGIIDSSREVEALAASVDSSDGVYLVPAFAGLGAPRWDPYARGTMHGITRGTTSAHIARAALDSIALQVADVAEAMENDAGIELSLLRVDGGAAANDLLMQFQADLLQTAVVRPGVLETTALGAAYLAGLATGYWDSVDAIRENQSAGKRFEPEMEQGYIQEIRGKWTKAVERSLRWVDPD